MQEEVFEPFKQKVIKVIQKSINLGKNKSINQILEKVNFYLTSISESPNKKRYQKIMINTQKQDLYAPGQNYSKLLERGVLLQTKRNSISKRLTKSSLNLSNLNKQTSNQMFLRSRPQSSSIMLSSSSSLREKRAISAKSMRYHPSSDLKQNLHKKSINQNQKQKFQNFLDIIQNTYEQLSENKNFLKRKINKMKKQWDIDQNGNKFQSSIILPANQQTLHLIKRQRNKLYQKEEIDEYIFQ